MALSQWNFIYGIDIWISYTSNFYVSPILLSFGYFPQLFKNAETILGSQLYQ